MIEGVPVTWGQVITLELPNGEFLVLDTRDQGNECGNEIKLDYLDHTGEFQSSLLIHPK